MKAKDILLLNNTITQNHLLARRAWFWHVASQFITLKLSICRKQTTRVGIIITLNVFPRDVLGWHPWTGVKVAH